MVSSTDSLPHTFASFLILSSYLNRVIQELIRSRQKYCIIGLHRFEWFPFIMITFKAHLKTCDLDFAAAANRTLWLLGQLDDIAKQRPATLLSLLYFTRSFKATDPRDHVFALLGLASDSNDFPEPNYEMTVEQLYQAISSSLVRQGNGFLMLRLAGIRPTNLHMPSWVVDWRDLDIHYSCKQFTSFCSGGSDGRVELGTDPSIIHVLGKITDRVVAAGQPFKTGKSLWERLEEYIVDCTTAFQDLYECATGTLAIQKDLASLISFDMKCDTNYKFQEACLFTQEHHQDQQCQDMVALDDSTFKQVSLMYYRFYLKKLDRWLSKINKRGRMGRLSRFGHRLKLVETPRTLAEDAIADGIAKTSAEENCLRYKFFHDSTRPIITEKGRLSLAPFLTEKGDVVCVIHGAKAPFVLRPCEDGTYRIVGEAYVRDIMFGEALKEDDCPVAEILIR